jgi:PBP1b-binding outer membrane lipoprotein LpoB
MKKLVYLFVIGLFFIGCGPSPEEQAKAEEAAKEQVQEIADDIEKMAEEMAEEIVEESTETEDADSIATEETPQDTTASE